MREREREGGRERGERERNKNTIITLNENGLNAPIKRHRVAEWIRNHDLHIYCLPETHHRTK